MGIAYEKVAGRQKGSEQSYDIQHSGAVIVLNPKGEIQAFFNWPHKPKDMASDFVQLIKE
jgi:protein SCO1/2